MLLLTIILSSLLIHHATAAGESFEVEYYTNVSLPCNYTAHDAGHPEIAIPFKRYWVLPNSSVLADTFQGSDRLRLDPTLNDFNLVILNVDDDDFGVYHCVMLWNSKNYDVTTIPIGLNENGPLYKKQLEEFERNVLIGGLITSGVVLILLVVIAVWFCKQRNRNKDRSFDDDITYQASDEFSTNFGYGGETRKCPIDPEPELPSAETETDTEVYAKLDKSRISSTKSSPNNNDVITEQSVYL